MSLKLSLKLIQLSQDLGQSLIQCILSFKESFEWMKNKVKTTQIQTRDVMTFILTKDGTRYIKATIYIYYFSKQKYG